MKNAHLRFGWLTYIRTTEKATTNIKLRLDRFIGEVRPDPPREAKAHLISVIGGDTQVSAVAAAISLGERFRIEAPGIEPIRVCLERNAQSYRGSLSLNDRKKPLRHLIGVSEELLSVGTGKNGRTLLACSVPEFVWASLVHSLGLPGVPEWAQWFCQQLVRRKALVPLLGVGCDPVLVKGRKEQFLSWLKRGVESGALRFPDTCGPIPWPRLSLASMCSHPSI